MGVACAFRCLAAATSACKSTTKPQDQANVRVHTEADVVQTVHQIAVTGVKPLSCHKHASNSRSHIIGNSHVATRAQGRSSATTYCESIANFTELALQILEGILHCRLRFTLSICLHLYEAIGSSGCCFTCMLAGYLCLKQQTAVTMLRHTLTNILYSRGCGTL